MRRHLAGVFTVVRGFTAPFRALGALFGGGAGGGSWRIEFEPGRDVVLPPEREKLKRVGEVLGKRPQLKLTVRGGYDAKLDGEALRALRVRHDLAQRLEAKLKPGEDPGPVAFDDAKTQRALEALLTERGGGKAVDEVVAQYQTSSGKKADRANPALALIAAVVAIVRSTGALSADRRDYAARRVGAAALASAASSRRPRAHQCAGPRGARPGR